MTRIRMTIEGNLGEINAKSFVAMIQESLNVLAELDRALSRERKGTLYWTVSALGEGSSYIEVRSRITHGDEDFSKQVIRSFTNGLQYIKTERKTPPMFSIDSMKRIRRMVRLMGRDGISGYLVSSPEIEEEAHLSSEMDAILQELVGVHHKGMGSVEGKLELVSIHPSQRRFNVYHSITNKAVRCNLPKSLEQEVIRNIGRRVIVQGIVSYNVMGEPLSVEVIRIRVLRSEDELPSIEDTLGVAPDFTGDMTTEEHIRVLRDG